MKLMKVMKVMMVMTFLVEEGSEKKSSSWATVLVQVGSFKIHSQIFELLTEIRETC